MLSQSWKIIKVIAMDFFVLIRSLIEGTSDLIKQGANTILKLFSVILLNLVLGKSFSLKKSTKRSKTIFRLFPSLLIIAAMFYLYYD